MHPRIQLVLSMAVTLFAGYAWWSSHEGAGESALLAAMVAVTAYQWRLQQGRTGDR